MIAKSPEEKEALKLAKQKCKKSEIEYKAKQLDLKLKKESEPKYAFNRIGILNSEHILENDYPVNADYLYVVDDNGGKVIRSDVFGNILRLKRDLRSLGYKAENIYSCDIFSRRELLCK